MRADDWLRAHPYLLPVARFCDAVEKAAAGLEAEAPGLPAWDEHAAEFAAGVPLLAGTSVRIDLEPAGPMLRALTEALASASLPDPLARNAHALVAHLAADAGAAGRTTAWLLGDDSQAPPAPGLLRYLGWTALSRYLYPVLVGFSRWRDDARWLRRYCPVCGSLPAMAQLLGSDPGRKRLLSCGRCRTRWWFGRTACPFCEADSQRLAVFAIEGEGGLRIDWCESCSGYLKTYEGQGDEAWMLADWTSLHLDLAARERGLERLAASLFDLEALAAPGSADV